MMKSPYKRISQVQILYKTKKKTHTKKKTSPTSGVRFGSMTVTYRKLHFIFTQLQYEGWAQDYGNSNIFLKPLFRGNLDPFVNNANLGAIAHTSNGT